MTMTLLAININVNWLQILNSFQPTVFFFRRFFYFSLVRLIWTLCSSFNLEQFIYPNQTYDLIHFRLGRTKGQAGVSFLSSPEIPDLIWRVNSSRRDALIIPRNLFQSPHLAKFPLSFFYHPLYHQPLYLLSSFLSIFHTTSTSLLSFRRSIRQMYRKKRPILTPKCPTPLPRRASNLPENR